MTAKLIHNLVTIRPIWRLLILFSFGFLVFITLAHTAPNIYYSYLDNTEYYRIQQPVTVEEDKIKPGSKVTFIFERMAIENLKTENNSNLLVDNSGVLTRIAIGQAATFAIVKNPSSNFVTLKSKATIPPDAPTGIAHFEGVATYEIHGVRRSYVWISETFEITNN